MLRKKTVFWLAGLLLFPAVAFAGGGLEGKAEQQMGFADYLFQKGEYYRAITEYHRFLYLYPTDEGASRARFQVGACYYAAREWEDALNAWRAGLGQSQPVRLRQRTLYSIALAFYRKGRYTACREYLEQLKAEKAAPDLRAEVNKLEVLSYVEEEQWEKAAAGAAGLSPPLKEGVLAVVAKAGQAELKSPALASALSAVLPGAGQFYADRFQDGVMAFFLNGLFIWGVLEAYSHDKKVTAGILLFFETGWYFGNIYSAANSVHKYNREIGQSLREEAGERLNLRLEVPSEGGAGLSLSYRF